MYHFTSSVLLIAAAITCFRPTYAQDAFAAKDADLMVNRFYDITLLVEPRQQHPVASGTGGLQGGTLQGGGGFGGGGFGGGGQMGGGGGGTGGAGFFSLPLEPLQFGSGGGYALNQQSSEPSLKQALESTGASSIPSLIESHIASDTWSTNGGSGEINDLGNTLLIRQSEKAHSEIEKFLKELTSATVGNGTYQLEVWWIPATDADRLQLKSTLSDGIDDVEKVANISTLCESLGGFHGTLLCRDRVTAHTTSGKKVPIIAGSIPLISAGASGDQPIVNILHFGLMLEARLLSVPEYLTSAAEGKAIEQLELNFRSSITSRDVQAKQEPQDAKIDRYSMGQHEAAGSCRLQLGKPELIASLSELSAVKTNDAETTPELLMIVRVTRLEN